MHLQVDVGRPRLGVRWGVVAVGGVVLQAAALLQVGLELLTAPPAGQGEYKMNKQEKSTASGKEDETRNWFHWLNIRGAAVRQLE